jgi:hypothetical protein
MPHQRSPAPAPSLHTLTVLTQTVSVQEAKEGTKTEPKQLHQSKQLRSISMQVPCTLKFHRFKSGTHILKYQ